MTGPGGVTPASYTRNRSALDRFCQDRATIERLHPGPEPAPGYGPAPDWRVVGDGTMPCRFPVPIAGSVLGHVPGVTIDSVQRRYGMMVPQGADILEGDRVAEVVDLTGRRLNVRPMKVDAVVLRSTHALIVLEEYGVS